MPEIIRNSPSLLIPKELFEEEKIHDYWRVLHPEPPNEIIGKDDLENFFLLYSKPKEVDSMHEISVMYQELKEKYPNREHAVCINVYEDDFNVLVVKNREITYTGYFHYVVKEDVLYYLAHISQQFFENLSHVFFGYQQLSPTVLRLLNNYYEMEKV